MSTAVGFSPVKQQVPVAITSSQNENTDPTARIVADFQIRAVSEVFKRLDLIFNPAATKPDTNLLRTTDNNTGKVVVYIKPGMEKEISIGKNYSEVTKDALVHRCSEKEWQAVVTNLRSLSSDPVRIFNDITKPTWPKVKELPNKPKLDKIFDNINHGVDLVFRNASKIKHNELDPLKENLFKCQPKHSREESIAISPLIMCITCEVIEQLSAEIIGKGLDPEALTNKKTPIDHWKWTGARVKTFEGKVFF